MIIKILFWIIKYLPAKFVSRQARKPSGWFGKNLMTFAFVKGNALLLDFMMSLHDFKSDEVVCDLGFGPGELFCGSPQKLDKEYR